MNNLEYYQNKNNGNIICLKKLYYQSVGGMKKQYVLIREKGTLDIPIIGTNDYAIYRGTKKNLLNEYFYNYKKLNKREMKKLNLYQ